MNVKRRELLETIGCSATILPMATQSVSGTEPKPVRKLDVDVSEFEYLDEAVVTLFDEPAKNVRMAGTRPANPSEARGYRVTPANLRNDAGQWTPAQATAEVEVLPAVETYRASERESPHRNERRGAGIGGSSDVEPRGHDGSDGERDYEGGIWVRSEDVIDINLAITEGWIDWTASGGEVDYVKWKWHAVACDTGITKWYIDDAGHSYSDFAGNDVEVKFYGDYYNWNWRDNDKKTTAHHRLYTTGNPDGSMDWQTSHWYRGEDARSLRTDAGWFSKYDKHTGHC